MKGTFTFTQKNFLQAQILFNYRGILHLVSYQFVGSNENEDPENKDLRPKTHTKTKTHTKSTLSLLQYYCHYY